MTGQSALRKRALLLLLLLLWIKVERKALATGFTPTRATIELSSIFQSIKTFPKTSNFPSSKHFHRTPDSQTHTNQTKCVSSWLGEQILGKRAIFVVYATTHTRVYLLWTFYPFSTLLTSIFCGKPVFILSLADVSKSRNFAFKSTSFPRFNTLLRSSLCVILFLITSSLCLSKTRILIVPRC